MKRYKLISCSVFKNFVENFISENMLPVDAMFIPMGMHLNPEKLNKELQDEIDKAGKGYQAILLLYGLCGNSVLGLTAREIPIIIPRAHDCCTLFLESRKKFLENFDRITSYNVCYTKLLRVLNKRSFPIKKYLLDDIIFIFYDHDI